MSKIYLFSSFIFIISSLLTQNSNALEQDSTFSTTFIIRTLPTKTPHDATLYIATDFTGWFPDIATNQFEKVEGGSYQLVIQHSATSFKYKCTRGSWDSVEGRTNGRARPNRFYDINNDGRTVYIDIQSWEDLSYGSYHTYIYILAVAALQVLLLVVAINSIRNKNKTANAVLSALLILTAIALVGRASTYDPIIFNWQPKLLLTPEIILFTFAPLFYIYIHLLLKVPLPFKKYWWVHFIPGIIHIIIYIPYITMHNQTFIFKVLDNDLFPVFATSGTVALIYNMTYWFFCIKALRRYRDSELMNKGYQKYIQFLKVVLYIKACYLVLWTFASIVFILGNIFNIYTLGITEFSIDILWVLFSMIIFCLGYYAMKQPEIFKEEREIKYKDSILPKDEFEKVKNKLEDLMVNQKIYMNPDLTLFELSNRIPTSIHTLSRVINEGFNLSFSQYVNEKRIIEFIHEAEERNDFDSILSLAFQVGFNSKATFNRSFKKYTGTNPRLYFKAKVG